MQTIEYWEVSESYDKSETHLANFDNEAAAQELVGNNRYYSAYKRTVTLFNTVEEYRDNTLEKVRARALAKLTAQERAALGFK